MRKLLVAVMFLMLCISGFAQNRYQVNAGEGVQIDYSNPKVFEVADISITGLVGLQESALLALTGIKVGDKIPIPGQEISDGIKKLWNQGIIADVQFWLTKTEGDRAFIEVRVSERPRIQEAKINNVNSSQSSEMLDQLNISGKVATPALIKNSEIVIRKYFIEKGFLNTVVQTEQIEDSLFADRVRLNFNVDKKSKVKINKIYFDGNESFTDKRLKRTLKNTAEKPRFWLISKLFDEIFRTNANSVRNYVDSSYTVSQSEFKRFLNDNVKLNFLKGSKFINTDFEDDKNSLVAFYNSKGYRDAEVLSDEIVKVNEDFIDLKLAVEEGRKYYIRNIDWIGNFKYTDSVLTEKLDIRKGDVYNRQKLDERTQFAGPNGGDIMSLYSDDGYLTFRIQAVEVRAENDSIDIEMRMSEGEQATIKRIILNGNDRTSDHVILREIRTLPGQKYSRRELIRTIQELGQLGYFDPEQIDPQPIPNLNDGTVDIIFNLVEKSSDQIQLSGGFGGPFGFVGTVGLSLNNFSVRNIGDWSKWRPYPSGDGQKLSLQLQSNGRRFRSTSLVFSEPWLGGRKPNNFTVSLSRTSNRTIQPITNDLLGFLKATGVTVGLGRRLRWPDDYFQVQNTISYQFYDVFNFGNTLGFSTGQSNSLTFNTTISRSNIDNPQFPTYGSQFTLSVNATPPWSLLNPDKFADPELSEADRYEFVEYHKWMMDLSLFIPLNSKFVINARAHMGFIGTYSDKTDSGPFERFFLGGNGLNGANNFIIGQDIIALRGYDDNIIDPVDANTGFRGGVVYNKFVAELRYPVTLKPGSTIYLLAFMEAGNTWIDFSEYTPRKLFRSAGFGARIFLPAFGLLGVDWAHGFDSDDSFSPAIQAGSQVHFTIGQQIR
ncbi:BamA/OMP85 family outer membrane protein [Roseivirga sp.]|uniref:BamA/OMP85 family outer membrane protein n=1 Tax=Roseivirga sp. TaxID=1964215 RepID=UPI003B8BF9E9